MDVLKLHWEEETQQLKAAGRLHLEQAKVDKLVELLHNVIVEHNIKEDPVKQQAEQREPPLPPQGLFVVAVCHMQSRSWPQVQRNRGGRIQSGSCSSSVLDLV